MVVVVVVLPTIEMTAVYELREINCSFGKNDFTSLLHFILLIR